MPLRVVAVILAGLWVALQAVGQEDTWPSFRRTPDLSGVALAKLPGPLKKRWVFEAASPVYSTAAIVGGRVFFGTEDGRFIAVGLDDGKRKWTYQAGASISVAPLVMDGIAFVGDEDGALHAVNAADGKPVWKFAQPQDKILSSPAAGPDTVIFGSYDHHLYCLDRKTGALRWKFETEMQVHGAPCIAGGMAIIAGCDGQARGIGLKDGAQRLSVRLEGNLAAGPACRDGIVYFGSLSGDYLALRLSDSKVLWQKAEEGGQFFSTAAVTDSAAVFSSRSGSVFCVNPKDGKTVWTFKTKGSVDSSPVVSGKHVYVGSDDGNLYALGLADGKEAWRFAAGGAVRASPAVAAGRLVIGTEDGAVYCFGASDLEKK